jgi:hypothetical protein
MHIDALCFESAAADSMSVAQYVDRYSRAAHALSMKNISNPDAQRTQQNILLITGRLYDKWA